MKLKRFLLTLLCLSLLIAPAAAVEELIYNGDFSSGSSGWVESISTGSSGDADITYGNIGSSGTGAVYFTAVSGRDYVYASLSQSVDLTYAQTLSFDLIDLAQESISGFGAFVVEVGGNQVFTIDPNALSYYGWTTYTADVSAYTGTQTVTFKLYLDSAGNSHEFQVGLTGVSALSAASAPVLTTYTLSPSIVSIGEEVTATLAYSPGYPEETQIFIQWGDSATTSYLGVPNTAEPVTHTYSQAGTYTINAYAENSYGQDSWTTTVEVVSLDFSATTTSGEPPLTVGFQLSAVGFESFVWNFGDGTTSTELNPYHTYTATGTYTVTLTGTTASGKTYTKTKTNYISLAPQSISWSAAKYTSGDSAEISWQLRDPDYSNYQYTLHIYQSDSFGNALGDSIVTSALSGSSGTYTWDTSGSVGYYTAAVIRTGGSAATTLMTATTQVQSTATLTVNLATNGATYTDPTTVTLSQSGTIVDTQTTSTGQVQFTIPTGTYQVSATTTGYATQTASVQLLESTAITIDFITGTSASTNPSGAGSAYASTFVTFRVQDSGTGKFVDGARITAVGVQPTNPLEWMGNLFGAAWGQNIIDTELEGLSDMNGVVTFAMFPNVRYQLTITYNDITETRSFQPSTLTGEYLISLPITETNKVPATTAVVVSVETDDNNRIVLTYTDSTQTTSQITATLYQIADEERQLIETQPANAQEATLTFSPPSPSGNDYILSVTAITESYGTIEREFAISFPGPMVKIGNLPDEAYMVLCFVILLMLGGIGTFVTSRMYALVLVFVAILLWWFGWMFALGPVGGIALIICFVLAIAYYIASGGQPQ